MKKITYALLLISLLLSIFILPASAEESSESYTSALIDRDNNLTAAEEQKINEKIRWAESETDITFIIGIYSISEGIPSGISVVESLGMSTQTDDVVLLIIEVGNSGSFSGYSNNYYEMFTFGVANTLITDDSVNEILDSDSVYNNIKGGKLCNGALAFVDMSVSSIKSYRRGIIFAIIAASAVSAAVAVGAVLYTYKKKLKSPIYPLSNYADLKLTETTDMYLGKTVTRTRISSSSGGSGSSGRSGGGGGSRGRR